MNKVQSSNSFFTSTSFDEIDLTYLGSNDFLYCDPPYLITTGTYNDGKRGFKGWSEKEEKDLLKLLSNLNKRKVKFALSNVLIHKGNTNHILKSWIDDNAYHLHDINYNYSNSSYNTKNRDKNSSREILVTNYLVNNKEQLRQKARRIKNNG
jgi:DNA adenine methylase